MCICITFLTNIKIIGINLHCEVGMLLITLLIIKQEYNQTYIGLFRLITKVYGTNIVKSSKS